MQEGKQVLKVGVGKWKCLLGFLKGESASAIAGSGTFPSALFSGVHGFARMGQKVKLEELGMGKKNLRAANALPSGI